MSAADERAAARAEAHAAAMEGTIPLHDITGHLNARKVPQHLHGAWLSGIEDALEEQGFDTEDPDADGHGWERRALARAV